MIKHDQLMCADNKNGWIGHDRSHFDPVPYIGLTTHFYMIFEVCGPNHIFT